MLTRTCVTGQTHLPHSEPTGHTGHPRQLSKPSTHSGGDRAVGQAFVPQIQNSDRVEQQGIHPPPKLVGPLTSQNYFINQINISSSNRPRIKLGNSPAKGESMEKHIARNSIDMTSFHARSRTKKKLTQNSLCLNSAILNPGLILQGNLPHTNRGLLENGTSFGTQNPTFSSRRKAISAQKAHLASFACLATTNNTNMTGQQNKTSGSSIAKQQLTRLFSENSRNHPILSTGSSKTYQTSTAHTHLFGANLGDLHKQLQLRINLKSGKDTKVEVGNRASKETNLKGTGVVSSSSPGPQHVRSPSKVMGSSANKLALSLSSTSMLPGHENQKIGRRTINPRGDSGRFPQPSLTYRSTLQNGGKESATQGLQIEKKSQMLRGFRGKDSLRKSHLNKSQNSVNPRPAKPEKPSEPVDSINQPPVQ